MSSEAFVILWTMAVCGTAALLIDWFFTPENGWDLFTKRMLIAMFIVIAVIVLFTVVSLFEIGG